MGYGIYLKNKRTDEILELNTPEYIYSNNIPVEYDNNGNFRQVAQRFAKVGITYNYSGYFRDATEGDKRFVGRLPWDSPDGEEKNLGIRGIYGVSAEDSIPMLTDMIIRIANKYCHNGEWKQSERKRERYFDSNGVEITNNITAIIRCGDKKTITSEKYTISEGDTSDYWEPTAANAIRSLKELINIAIQCIGMDGIWDGD